MGGIQGGDDNRDGAALGCVGRGIMIACIQVGQLSTFQSLNEVAIALSIKLDLT